MSTAVATAKPGSQGNASALLLLLKLRTFIALIVVTLFFALMAPNFVSLANAIIISKHVAINAILAIGMTYVILTGGIDLSVGSIVGLTGMVAGGLLVHGVQLPMLGVVVYPNVPEVIGIALLVGTA
ncbi:MAG: sugar transporter permease, partial [Devosia sp.]|nr:sugar transporter permease [Devosia sp.]